MMLYLQCPRIGSRGSIVVWFIVYTSKLENIDLTTKVF